MIFLIWFEHIFIIQIFNWHSAQIYLEDELLSLLDDYAIFIERLDLFIHKQIRCFIWFFQEQIKFI